MLKLLQVASFSGSNIDLSAWEDKKNPIESRFLAQACHHIIGTLLGKSHLDCLFSCTTKLISCLHKSCCRFVSLWLLALVGSNIDPSSSWEDKKNPGESRFPAQLDH
ncbi:hypothetical protein P3S67_023202 [Capsicum chacoense]